MDPKAFTDVLYVALTLFGEARGEPDEAKRLIAWDIRNRKEAKGYPKTYPEVVTQHAQLKSGKTVWQFSCWDPSDPNRLRMSDPMAGPVLEDEAWYACVRIAQEVIEAPPEANPIPGTLHYHDTSVATPSWAQGLEAFTMPGAPKFVFYRKGV